MTKIMLVEDDKSLREIYGIRLIAEGYEITSAGDGEEALAMAIKEKPDLIVSDVMMPKISGFDMLDILKSTPETKDIKVIMMTALSSEDQRTRGEKLGADKYLVKSQVGIEDVVRAVHDILADTPSAKAATSTPSMQFSAPQAPVTVSPSPVASPVTPSPETTMPQPTAPFSTPAPASLAVNFQAQQPNSQIAPAAPMTPPVAPLESLQTEVAQAPVQPTTFAPKQFEMNPEMPAETPMQQPASPTADYAAHPTVTAPEPLEGAVVETPQPVAPAPALEQTDTTPSPVVQVNDDLAEKMARELEEGLKSIQSPTQTQ
jgi:CheY-like chemotaxis protein